jgi:tripartite-type tricarboxylate transporter receptor subunit TctC
LISFFKNPGDNDMKTLHRRPWMALTAVLLMGAPAAASAQNAYPSQTLKIIVPFTPGTGMDTIARVVAPRLSERLGQPVVVQNQPGASGNIGAEAVAKSAPDGYTLGFVTTGQLAILPHMQKLAFDPLRDVVAVTPLSVTPFLLAVSPNLPVANVREFIDYAKARPGKLNYGAGGVGSVGHFAGAMFNARSGIDVLFLSYKGAAQATAALSVDEIQMYFASYTDLVPLGRAGRVKLLGIATESRHPQLPELQAIAEVLPGFVSSTWNGLVAPTGTPSAIIERLIADCRTMVADREIAAGLQALGATPGCRTSAEFTRQVMTEYAAFRDAAKAAGIKPE